jgi:hypothetical protein
MASADHTTSKVLTMLLIHDAALSVRFGTSEFRTP